VEGEAVKPEPYVWIVVPLVPPSGNHYKKPVRRGEYLGFYLTKEAKAFKEAVWVESARRRVEGKLYSVEATIYQGKGDRGDVDNYGKVLLDSLQDAQVIRSDAAVIRLVLEKKRDWANPRTEICVRGAEVPGKVQRALEGEWPNG
jgi:Holliday junction resolvase RusA-like endonuclease